MTINIKKKKKESVQSNDHPYPKRTWCKTKKKVLPPMVSSQTNSTQNL